MDDLFSQIRANATPSSWSKGVELARQDCVTGDSEEHGEIKLRVLTKNGVSPTVTLIEDEEDWHCSCGGDEDPCSHVTAAVIALKRAREQGKPLPRSEQSASRLAYRLQRTSGGLSFEREIVGSGPAEILTVALTALTSGRVKGPSLAATAEDLQVEVALGSTRRGVLPASVMPTLMKALHKIVAANLELTLDGAAIAVDPMPVGLMVQVTDEGPGVRVALIQDPAITELFSNGVALTTAGLRPVVLPNLTPDERGLLRSGRLYGQRDLASVVAEVLPGLTAKMPGRLDARNLPQKEQYLRPELELNLTRDGDGLRLQASITYGHPTLAYLREERFVVLGDRVPVRDLGAESSLRDELRRFPGLPSMELGTDVVLAPAEAVRCVQRLGRFPGHIVGAALGDFKVHGELTAKIEIHGQDTPSFKFTAASAMSSAAVEGAQTFEADAGRVLAAWRTGESLVPLLGGGFAQLPRAWLDRHGDRVLDFLAARGTSPDLPKIAWPLLVDLADATGTVAETLPPALVRFCQELKHGDAQLATTPLRSKLQATLRPYQEDGVRWLHWLRTLGLGALLADDMGLGKTIQTLSLFAAASGKERTLVVAPTSVIFNWAAEARKFRPDLKVCLFHGAGRVLDPDADLVITTYALLRIEGEALRLAPWAILVLDEAQMLKNPDSQAARAATKITAAFRLALTGTPVENHLDDLWSLMHLLNPGLLGDRKSFQERYTRRILAGDQDRAATLRARIKPFVLRRLKRDVVPDLPPRTETVLYVEMAPAERDRYDIIRAATRKEILDQLEHEGQRPNMLAALEALLRLRQASCHPDLLPGVDGESSSKLQLLTDTLLAAVENQHKILVFSQWTRFLDLIEPALECAGLSYLRLDGSTTDRQAVVRAFQTDSGPPILLMSLKAGGVGLNLTAADHVIITDPWWNPAAEDQAADRAHRIGQERPVLIQRLVSLGTVEERILELQEKKRALAQAALSDTGAAPTAITTSDLIALLD